MNKLRKVLQEKENIIGTQTFLGSKEIHEILGSLSYDFIFICAEHPSYGIETIYNCVKSCENSGTPALVRLPEYDITYTKKILDMGVSGVLFPMLKNADEVSKAMDLCLYPPFGKRGFGPMSAVKWGVESESEFVKDNFNNTVRMIQIEHIDAVNDINNIVKNKFVDAYIFGPNDLASSIGHINDIYNIEVKKTIKKAIHILKDNGKKFGVSLGTIDVSKIDYWKEMGMNIFSIGSDFAFIRDGAKYLYNELKNKTFTKNSRNISEII